MTATALHTPVPAPAPKPCPPGPCPPQPWPMRACRTLRDLLADPASRPAPVEASGTSIALDFSRQAVTAPVLEQLLALADQAGVAGQRDTSGEVINTSEQRAVLHVALRGTPGAQGDAAPWGSEVQQLVQTELTRACAFAEAVRSGQQRGSTAWPTIRRPAAAWSVCRSANYADAALSSLKAISS